MLYLTGTTFGGASGGTSGAIDTTGADFIAIVLSCSAGALSATLATISDNKGNTPTATGFGGVNDGTNNSAAGIAFFINPTVGSGHTFTVANGMQLQSMCIAAYKRCTGGADVQSAGGGTSGSFTVQPGSVTPSQSNSLIITAVTMAQINSTFIADQGFTVRQYIPAPGGSYYGGALADLIQGSAAAVNPTFTSDSNGGGLGARSYVFKGQSEAIPFCQILG